MIGIPNQNLKLMEMKKIKMNKKSVKVLNDQNYLHELIRIEFVHLQPETNVLPMQYIDVNSVW